MGARFVTSRLHVTSFFGWHRWNRYPLEVDLRRKILRECEALHTWPNSSCHSERFRPPRVALKAIDPAIRLNHCRGPMVSICWTMMPNPPVWPVPAANRTSPTKSRNQKSGLYFMALEQIPNGRNREGIPEESRI